MKIPFVGAAYQAASPNANAQRAVNCYLELDGAGPNAPALYGTPGTVTRFTLPKSGVRGCIEQGAYSYWVAGNGVYRVDSGYNATLLGVIGTSAGQLGLASNGTEVLIVDGASGWLATESALTEIADVDFPAGVTRCAYLNGFFLVTGLSGSQKFWFNEVPNDGAGWNGTDFASAEGAPDNTVGLINDHGELLFMGSRSGEVWAGVENSDLPFQRSVNAFIETGCAAAGTLAKLDNSVFWLSADDRGGPMVMRMQGYAPIRVSTHALEYAMQGYARIDDAFAFTLQLYGHAWYALTFPTADATWVYDVSTNSWFEWAWFDASANALHRHRANCHLYWNGEHLIGDWESGKVYALDADTYTDDGGAIKRLRATQCLDSPDGERIFYSSLTVDMETGVGLATGQGSDPLLMLRYSNDGGHTWSNEKTRSLGRVGQYGKRVRFGPSGAGRNRVWEISCTDPVKFVVLGAMADMQKGTS